jgi:hypothetical protein
MANIVFHYSNLGEKLRVPVRNASVERRGKDEGIDQVTTGDTGAMIARFAKESVSTTISVRWATAQRANLRVDASA